MNEKSFNEYKSTDNLMCYGIMSVETLQHWLEDLPKNSIVHVDSHVISLGEDIDEQKNKKK